MSQHSHGTIQNKFLLGLAAIFLVLGAVFLVSLHMHLREMLHIEAEAKAELVFSHVSSVQDYVRTILRPAVSHAIPPDNFLLEAMSSSFVTRKVLIDLNTQRDQYVYRRVALTPRNPKSAANAVERELIDHFQDHPEERRYGGYQVIDGMEHYVMARPVRFDQECLTCHGDPEDAPRVLIERYGAERGFGRKQGELAGLDFVGMPVDKPVKQIRESVALFGQFFFAVAAGVFLLISIFFNRLVVTNLRRLSAIFRKDFQSPQDQAILNRLDQGDEISSLLEAFEAFATHLREARRQLEDYAANLESKVQERTADLSREAAEHRTDVRLFVDLLGDLNSSHGQQELLRGALPHIARRFGASRAAYRCAPLGRHQFSWPDTDADVDMPTDWLALILTGDVRIEADRAFVPVGSADWGRGIMGIFWDHAPRPELSPEILLALGRQLGIALENLEAVDALLRQNTLLERIVEGISDPLLLVDAHGAVVLANASARTLLPGLQPGRHIQDWFPALAVESTQAEALLAALTGSAASGLELELPGFRHLAVNIYPLRGGTETGRAVVYIRETTLEKRMLAQMRQSEKLAALGKLAAGLAHEINNPLGVISCYTQLLRKSQTEAQAQEDLAVIERHTEKARKVVQDLLGLARKPQSAPGATDLNELARGMIQLFRVQADAAKITLDVDPTPDLPPVAADKSTLEQIVTNLLVNALDAAPAETGRIVIRTEPSPDGRAAWLTVRDNGPGIPPEHRTQVFDPFFTTKEIGKGTGLGLTVVHELMRELGGSAEILDGPGAAFRLVFPVGCEIPWMEEPHA